MAAFASVARQLVCMHDKSDEAIAYFMKTFSMPQNSMHKLVEILRGPDAFQASGAPPHLRAAIGTSCQSSWFTIQGLREPMASGRGAKAGDPSATSSSLWSRAWS